MKLPPLEQLAALAAGTIRRFPFALCDALVGAGAAVALFELGSGAHHQILGNLVLAAALGLPLFTALPLVAEQRRWPRPAGLAIQAGAAVLLLAYALSLPRDSSSESSIHIIRFLFLDAGLHFFVAFAPFAGRGEMNGFWQYNKALFLRFLTAVLYATVLYAGLALTLLTVHGLLGIHIAEKRYAELWALVTGVFQTWVFLAGVPQDLTALESRTDYPAGLKVFTQSILLPLLALYLLVLYVYEVKILVQWHWPKGLVSSPVIGFSITGVLALLLLWPIRDRVESPWIRVLARWFYLALLPLVAMLLLAIGRRISEYGITETRYVVAVLGAWLAGIAIYFLASRRKNIQIIPATLCLIAFAASVGPWGAFGVSERSQVGRLSRLLASNHILVGGRIRATERTPAFADLKEISAIVKYLADVHGLSAISGWFGERAAGTAASRRDSLASASRYEQPRLALQMMGIPFVTAWQSAGDTTFSLEADTHLPIRVKGYEHLIRSQYFNPPWAGNHTVELAEARYALAFHRETSTLTVTLLTGAPESVRVDLAPRVAAVLAEFGEQNSVSSLPPERLAVEDSSAHLRVRVYLINIQGTQTGAIRKLERLEVEILAGRRSE